MTFDRLKTKAARMQVAGFVFRLQSLPCQSAKGRSVTKTGQSKCSINISTTRITAMNKLEKEKQTKKRYPFF